MTIKYSGDNITFSDSSIQSTAATGFGFKNRILNGDMRIDQRNAGASVTIPAGSTTYTVDRWAAYGSQASKFSVQRNAGSVTPPDGFTNYLGVTSLSAYAVLSSDAFWVGQKIEGFNTADLGFGTAQAKTITISFIVRSSLTGTFGGSIINNNGTRGYPFSYSIPSANAWTTITVTVPGDTTGTWDTSTNTGLWVIFGLGVGTSNTASAGAWTGTPAYVSAPTGATSVVGTNGATFYITGVDLRKGSVGAYSNGQNDFDYRPYSTELALCQRYCLVYGGASYSSMAGSGYAFSTTGFTVFNQPPVQMRATPSVSTSGNLRAVDGQTATAVTGVAINGNSTSNLFIVDATVASGLTQYRPYTLTANNDSTARTIYSAEL